MQNFVYCNPTELVFGRGAHKEIGMRMLPWAKDGKKALVIYGGGSAKRSGVLDDVVAGCEAAGLTVLVKGGVKPNPEMDFVREVTAFARAENVNLIIAVGGGSVIDTAKAVAASVPYAGDGWDFFTGKVVPETCLPVGAVLTIPAAGSESSIRCVITQGNEKFGMGNGVIRPKVAVINPELFFTLPKKQVAAGVIDMMSHIMERYFTNTPAVDYTSGQAEAALKTIMANGLKVMENVRDYDAWSQVGLAGTFAHNGYFGLGFEEDWACHGMEHALSGWDTTITHGFGLAAIIPSWMRYVAHANEARFVQFARNVMGVEKEGSAEEVIALGIAKFTVFLQKMELPTRLSELTDKPVPVKEIAALATKKGPLGHFKVLTTEDVEALLTAVL